MGQQILNQEQPEAESPERFRDFPTIDYTVFLEEYPELIQYFLSDPESPVIQVTVRDFPFDLIEGPEEMPTNHKKVESLRRDIERTHAHTHPDRHSNGILIAEPIQIVLVPNPTLPDDVDGESIGTFVIVNGFHRMMALRQLIDPESEHFNPDFARTACVHIEFGSWDLVLERRFQAQAGHESIAMARLVKFLAESTELTEWGRKVPLREILHHTHVLAFSDDSRQQHIERLAASYETTEDMILRALNAALMVLEGSHITANEATEYIRIGTRLPPERADLVRSGDKVADKQRGEISLGAAAILGRIFPYSTHAEEQDFMYKLYVENPGLLKTRFEELLLAANRMLPTLSHHAITLSEMDGETRPLREIRSSLLFTCLANMWRQQTPFENVDDVIRSLDRIPELVDTEDLEIMLLHEKWWKPQKAKTASTQGMPTKQKTVVRSTVQSIVRELLELSVNDIRLAIAHLDSSLQAHAELAVLHWAREAGLYRSQNGTAEELMSKMDILYPHTVRMLCSREMPLSPQAARELFLELCPAINEIPPGRMRNYVRTYVPDTNVPLANLGQSLRMAAGTIDHRRLGLDKIELLLQDLEDLSSRFAGALANSTHAHGSPNDKTTRDLLRFIQRFSPIEDGIDNPDEDDQGEETVQDEIVNSGVIQGSNVW